MTGETGMKQATYLQDDMLYRKDKIKEMENIFINQQHRTYGTFIDNSVQWHVYQ